MKSKAEGFRRHDNEIDNNNTGALDSDRPMDINLNEVQPLQMDFSESIQENLMKKDKENKRKVIKSQQEIDQYEYWHPRCLNSIGICCTPFVVLFPCFCCCMEKPLFRQETAACGLLEKFGRYSKVLTPGLHVINPISQRVVEVSMKTKIIQFEQTAFTRDNVQFYLQTIVFYRIVNPAKLIYNLGSTDRQLVECISEIAQGTLRTLIGENSLQEIIQHRQLVGNSLKIEMNRMLEVWGILIESSSIKNIKLNKDIQQALSAVPKTKRLMEAYLIGYKADVEVGKLLKEMSLILDSKAAFQIRYLDLVGQIISNPNNQKTIIINTSNVKDYTNNKPNQLTED